MVLYNDGGDDCGGRNMMSRSAYAHVLIVADCRSTACSLDK